MRASKSTNRPSPFHSGELEIQSRVGVRDESDDQGRISIRKFMPDQHRTFFELLPFLMVGAVDRAGWPICSMLVGPVGFVHSPTPISLRIDRLPFPGDPLRSRLAIGLDVGILGIDLDTRRRNRMNGRVTQIDGHGFTVEVGESFGNCPQYIQGREFYMPADGSLPIEEPVAIEPLDGSSRRAIEQADTFFVASAIVDPNGDAHRVDISHRGGRKGFVRTDSTSLTIPDFAGNNFFNTLGNFAINPRAGLLFPNFETGDLRYLAGSVEIVWDGDEIRSFKGAKRLWRVTPSHGWLWRFAIPLRWRFRDYAPTTEQTGTWREADQTRRAKSDTSGRSFRVDDIADEATAVKSYYLSPADGQVVPAFLPGQHVTVSFPPVGPVSRPYSISSAPGEPQLRISVKRELGFSKVLHDALKVGSVLRIGPPSGNFVLPANQPRPALLLSAGIGITPMISMAKHVIREAAEGVSRPVVLVHVGRNGRERPFRNELVSLAREGRGALRVHLILTRPSPEDRFGQDYDSFGRPSVERLSTLIDLYNADIYVCGPNGFMQSVYNDLLAAGVDDERIFAETFGPSSLVRARAKPEPDIVLSDATWQAPVAFASAGRTVEWSSARGTLLDLAEAEGLNPSYGCRSGECGSCAVRILRGEVRNVRSPSFVTHDQMALLCCAIPAEPAGKDTLALEA